MTFAVDHRHLTMFRRMRLGHQRIHCLRRVHAPFEEVEALIAQPWIGHILRRHSANAGPGPGTARRNGDRGGGDCYTEHTGLGATADKRKGHLGPIPI
jgi:hypothetical protein